MEPVMEPTPEAMSEIGIARAMFAEAYASHDVEAMSALFHPDVAFAGTLHPYWMEGKETIQRLWAYYFGTYRNASMIFWSSSFRALSREGVVVQYATATMAMPDGTGRVHNVHMRLSVVWVRVPDYTIRTRTLRWQIAHMHGSEAPLFR